MITALLVAALGLQEHATWERFAPGSWVEHRTTGTREGREVRTVQKTIFRDITPTELVLGTETTDAKGGRVVGDMKYPLPQRGEPAEAMGTRRGSEELSIGGKTFACDIWERRGVRRWISAGAKVNGGVLKSEAISGSVKVLTRVVKLEAPVRVGKADIACWVREDVTDTGDQKTTRTHWISDEVPGAYVRTEVRQVQGDQTVEETDTVLTAFEVVKK